MRPSFALVLFVLAAGAAVATSCTQRHRLGGRYDEGAGGEAGAAEPPHGSGAATSTGGSSGTPAGGSSSAASGGSAGSGASAGVSGAAQQPDPGVLL